eukprot:TRINITY_DN3548_c5_g1_i1.p1 TRINITY_DN3548_c5_g1~~TRINITY_DN3548_c5_g1_i1.p1  ORF type:complete len:654 (+),score=216.20 TRINITY_DN3548_c5_g1_i1:129-1964(+)
MLTGADFGWVVLAAGFCVHLCLGTANSWGNLSTYVTSYLRAHGAPEATYGETFWVFGSLNAAQSVMVVLGGFVQMRLGPRATCILGACGVGAATLLSSVTVSNSLWLFTATYGILFGFGVGTAYTCPMVAAIRYMPERKGLINGVITLGFGLGAFVFNFLMTWFLNPHGCQPVCAGRPFVCPPAASILAHSAAPADCVPYFPADSIVVARVPSLFLLLGGIYAAVGLLCGACIVPPTESDYDEIDERESVLLAELTPRSMPRSVLTHRSTASRHHMQRRPSEDGLMGAVATEWSAAWKRAPPTAPRQGEARPLLQGHIGQSPQRTLEGKLRGSSSGHDLHSLDTRKSVHTDACSRPWTRISRATTAMTARERADDAASCAPSWYPQEVAAPELTFQQFITSAVGWQLWLGFFCAQFGGTYIVGQFKMYGQQQPWSSDSFEQLVSSLMAVASGLGSCSHGIASDHVGFASLLVANASIQALALLTFGSGYAVSSQASWAGWCVVSAFCFGGNFSVFPTACCALAGRENFGANFGFVFTGFGAQSLVLAVLGSVAPGLDFVDMTRIGGALCAVALLNAILLLHRESEAEAESEEEKDDGPGGSRIPICVEVER